MRVARGVAWLVLCAALGCAERHGLDGRAGGEDGRAGRNASSAGERARAGRGGAAGEVTDSGAPPDSGGGPAADAGSAASCTAPAEACFSRVGIGTAEGRLQVADIDGDGRLDLVAGGLARDGSWIDLEAEMPAPLVQRLFERGADRFGDVSGDGRADAIWIQNTPCGDCDGDRLSLGIGLGDGTGTFPETRAELLCRSTGTPPELTLADLDGDGDQELLIEMRCDQFSGPELAVLEPSAGGPLEQRGHLGQTLDLPLAADIDGDGRIDLAGIGPAELRVFPGMGGFRFADRSLVASLPAGVLPRVLRVMDVDDGGRDLVLLSNENTTRSFVSIWSHQDGLLELRTNFELAGFFSEIELANADDDCGEEILALAPELDATAPGQLLGLDPESGAAQPLPFVVQFETLASLQDASGQRRLYARTVANEVVELTVGACLRGLP